MKSPVPVLIGTFLALVQFSSGRGEAAFTATSGPRQVSFRRDVEPVLSLSCTTASCHGGGTRPPVLDVRAGSAKMRAALVGVASEERPDRAYIQPGDPDASFLVQKIEGHLVNAECAAHDCGEPMPLDNPSLSPSARATLRAWIVQGALDN